MEPSIALAQPRKAAQEALDTAEGVLRDPELLAWLERQLVSLLRQMDAILLDLASGISIADLGFSQEEFDGLVEDIAHQVAVLNLQIGRARQQQR